MASIIENNSPAAEKASPPSSNHDHDVSDRPEPEPEPEPDAPSAPSDEGYVYPPMKKVVPILIALYMAMFLVALDRTIIATAIPKITDDFKSLGDIGWYGSAYLLTASALMLTFGKIYTYYSPKIVLLSAIVIFEIGSALCGAAPSSVALIVGRAIAGSGSAGIFTGCIVAVQNVVPLRQRPMVMGAMGAIFGVASVAGPLLGGAFTDLGTGGWRWCFYINLPIGAVTLVILLFILKLPAPAKAGTGLREQFLQLDPLGTFVFLPAVVCLLLALQWGGSTYAWDNARIIALLVLFGVLIAAFVGIQIWLQEAATVPPRIFKQRSILAGFMYSFCSGAAMLVMVYFIPVYFQAIKGVSAVRSGIDTLPFLLALVLASISAGAIVSALGYYVPLMLAAPVLMSIGSGLVSTFTPDTPVAKWIGYQILFGFGQGMGMQQSSVAAQTVLSRKDIAIGAALMMFSLQVSGAIFISVGQNVLENKLVAGLRNVVGLDANVIVNTGATELRNVVAPKLLGAVLTAYSKALDDTFYVAVAMSALSIIPALFMEWKSVKGQEKGAAGVIAAEAGEADPTIVVNEGKSGSVN